jgi:subtilisin family serine protease
MERAIELARLRDVMAKTAGSPAVRIGLVDGMVEGSHPALANARVQAPGGAASGCEVSTGLGCRHATFLATVLVGEGGICPGVTLVSQPVFLDRGEAGSSSTRPDAIAGAIHDLLDSGVDIVNVSGGIAAGGLKRYPAVEDACARALDGGVLVVAASGNQGRIGVVPLFGHEWVVPVASCAENGEPDLRSNIGPSVGRRGLRAPGFLIRSGGTVMQGSSVAAVFVTGTLALLRSLFPRRPAAELRSAILLQPRRQLSVVPPLLDAAACLAALRRLS